MEISMNIKKKILGITIAPVITLGLISMFLTTTMVRSAMLEEIEEALRGTAAATLAATIRIQEIICRPATGISGKAAIIFQSLRVS